MSHGIDLDDINPYEPTYLREQTVALIMGKEKVNQYVAKGRVMEAQGARAVVRIMDQAFRREPEIDTGWGEL